MQVVKLATLFLATTICLGCTGIPDGLEPVTEFEVNRYLGKWYEIARLDHSFERGLSNVTAIYTDSGNGNIFVKNRGFNEKNGEWKEIEGNARFTRNDDIGSLKVSFFGPFYGGYHIIALDKVNYSYAMIAGPSRSYLWILSRTPSINQDVYLRLVNKASDWGFDTTKLIEVAHDHS